MPSSSSSTSASSSSSPRDIPERDDGPGSQWLPGVNDGAWWQLVTNMFAHVEILHIAFNMLALWVLGPQLELAVGRSRSFLVLAP